MAFSGADDPAFVEYCDEVKLAFESKDAIRLDGRMDMLVTRIALVSDWIRRFNASCDSKPSVHVLSGHHRHYVTKNYKNEDWLMAVVVCIDGALRARSFTPDYEFETTLPKYHAVHVKDFPMHFANDGDSDALCFVVHYVGQPSPCRLM
jgi:hypothetical protein